MGSRRGCGAFSSLVVSIIIGNSAVLVLPDWLVPGNPSFHMGDVLTTNPIPILILLLS